MPPFYPIFLDLTGRRCVVIGGSQIAGEKAGRLLEYGADVVVIAPETCTEIVDLSDKERLTWIRRHYQDGDLEGACIAIVADTGDAATIDAVDSECRNRNVPLNVVDLPNDCTWIAPAVARVGDVVVAVSTGGASPALAKKMREELQGVSRIKTKYHVMALATLAPLLSKARRILRDEGISIYADHWQASLSDDLIELIEADKSDEAETILMTRLRTGDGCQCTSGVCRMWLERSSIQPDVTNLSHPLSMDTKE